MKNSFIIALSALTISAMSQTPISVSVDKESLIKNNQYAYSVEIPQATIKETKNNWLRYAANSSQGKASAMDGMYIQLNAVNKNVSPYPFNLYSKLIETTQGVKITIRIASSNVRLVSEVTDNNQSLAIQKYLHDFAVMEYKAIVTRELKMEENKLSVLENELKRTVKSSEKSTKTINDNNRTNDRDAGTISSNNAEINESGEKIAGQKEMVNVTASDPNANKGALKTLDQMKDDKKGLQNDNESMQKSTEVRNKENRAEDKSLSNSEQKEALLTSLITEQKVKIQSVKQKLASIM